MLNTQEMIAWLDHIALGRGSHLGPNGEACVMEAVSYVAREPWSDHPECASPTITSFLVKWNDSMADTDRQMLKPYVPRIVGTRTTKEDEMKRAWLLTDWLAREYAPAFLRCAGLTEQAVLLEGLAPLTSSASIRKARVVAEAATEAAAWAAAGAAARDAARAAAGAAAGAAARDVAWDAAGAAARDAAGDAAWAAARDAAGDAAGAAARDAARAAAGAAAWAAARAAARDAAGDAAWAALRPTVELLQTSALRLLDRMIDVGKATA